MIGVASALSPQIALRGGNKELWMAHAMSFLSSLSNQKTGLVALQ